MNSTAPVLPPASLKLLRLIAVHDTGAGVHFDHQPRNCWQLAGTKHVARGRSFHPLECAGFLTGCDSNTEPVRITAAGREYLQQLATPPSPGADHA